MTWSQVYGVLYSIISVEVLVASYKAVEMIKRTLYFTQGVFSSPRPPECIRKSFLKNLGSSWFNLEDKVVVNRGVLISIKYGPRL